MVDILTITPEIIKFLPAETLTSFGTLITILKTAGIIFIIYLIFQITNIILNIKRNKRIKIIEQKVNEIDNKINKLLEKKKK